jgi:hypothetical protein
LVVGAASYVGRFGQPTAGPRWPAVIADTLLFTGFALHHSLFARLGVKAWLTARVAPMLERSAYVWASSALFLAACLAWRPVSGTAWRVSAPVSALLYAFQIAGIILTALASRRIGVLSLSGIRQVFGPPGVASPTLHADGLYAIVRHPVYLAWVLMVWPTPQMTGTRLLFAALSTTYLVLAIPLEERALAREFGPAYQDYARVVRWRMLPGLY